MHHRIAVYSFCALSLFSAGHAAAEDDLIDVLQKKGVLSTEEATELKTQQKTRSSVSTEGGFKILSGDGSASLQIGTLQQLDYAAFKQHKADLADGTLLRRSRFSIGGNFLKDWQYRVEYEFSGNTGVTDAYVAYTGYQPLTITVGNFKRAINMEELSAAKGISFMERGLPFAFINVGNTRSPGIMLSHAGKSWSGALELFGEPLSTAQTAAGDEGYGFAGRLTAAPLLRERNLIHLGLGGLYRTTTGNTGGAGRTIQFSNKPEANQASQSFVSTGAIGGNVKNYSVEDLELAMQHGAASLQAEYLFTQVNRDAGGDLNFSGWYAQIAYTLTGEARPYKVDRGVFDMIRAEHNFGNTGIGAFEIAARLSAIDLSDRDINGGKQRDATLGLNWYPNAFLRSSANIVKVLKVGGGTMGGDTPTIYELRLQLAF